MTLLKTEASKYVVAGMLAFMCDLSVLYFCTEYLGWHYLISNIFSYSAGLVVSYWLNITWVFSYRRFKSKTWLEFATFSLVVFAGFIISEGLLAFFGEIAGLHYGVAKILSAVLVVVFNYVAKKLLLFTDFSESEHA